MLANTTAMIAILSAIGVDNTNPTQTQQYIPDPTHTRQYKPNHAKKHM